MKQNLQLKGKSIIDRLYLLCCVLFFVALAHNHFQLITYEILLDYNEPIMLSTTATIAAGKNPYSFESQPTHMYVYTPLTNIVVAPLTFVFGNTLQLHRAVNGIFMLAACGLCFLLTYKASHSIQNSVAAALIFYAGLLYYSTPIAGPNGLGLFLFLSSICIPWFFGFSNRSLIAGLLLGIVAFYAKQYFIASLGYLTLYLFIAISKKRAIIFAAFSAIFFLASFVIVNYTSPYFIENTIYSPRISTALTSSNKILLKQLLEYGEIYIPILTILGVLGGGTFWKRYIDGAADKSGQSTLPLNDKPAFFNLGNLSAPMFGRMPSYLWFCFICSLAVIVFAIGKNGANHLTYLFQLISPFLLAGTLVSVSKSMRLTWLYQLLLILAFYSTYSILPRDFSIDQKNWDRLRQVVSQGDKVYVSPIVLGEIIERGAPIYYNGSTAYFAMGAGGPAFLQKKDPEKTVRTIWKKYVNNIYSMIEHQEFDLFLLEWGTYIPANILSASDITDGKTFLKKYYQRTEVIKISLANRPGGGKYAMEVWRPRPTPLPQDVETLSR